MAANVSTGTTITFATSGWTGLVTGIAKEAGDGVPVVDVTHYGTTGYRSLIPGSLIGPGRYVVQFLLDDQMAATSDPQSVLGQGSETITIQLPLRAPAVTSGPTHIATGFAITESFDLADDQNPMIGEITVQLDGQTAPAWTAAA